MIKTEVSYITRDTGRVFHYYDGWLGIIDGRLDYVLFKNSILFKEVKFKVLWHWDRNKVLLKRK